MWIQWLIVLLPVAVAQNLTLTDGVSGFEVVEAVVNSIRKSCIFQDENLFLRRLAYVVSNDGVEPKTYRPGYNGGIWQVDETRFDQTKSFLGVTTLFPGVLKHFKINWANVKWSDLRKPLYSGLAAALYLETLAGTRSIPRGIEDQASFYALHYNTAPGAANQFLDSVHQLQEGCQRTNLDLVFIVDTSSSLSIADFYNATKFSADVVDAFNIGPNDVRVAYLTFSTGAKPIFQLDQYKTAYSVKAAIKRITYTPGHTDTDQAIDYVAKTFFTKAKGSRDGASKVVILITDGQSTDRDKTIRAAQAARDKGIIFYSIGVGSVDRSELNSIATKPVCTHTAILKNYNDLKKLTDEIQQVSCRAPAILNHGRYTFSCDQSYLFQIPVKDNRLLTTITVTDGKVDIYGSFGNPTPNSALHQFLTAAATLAPAVISVKHEARPLYLNITSSHHPNMCIGNFTIDITGVYLVPPNTVVTCDNGGMVSPCSVIDILKEIYHCIDPPYNIGNLCPPGHYGFVQYPNLQTRFVFCLNGKPLVCTCPPHSIYLLQQHPCVPGEPDTTSTTNTTTTPSPSTTTTSRQFIRNPCKYPMTSGDLFYYPHPFDRNKYIQCGQFGEAYIKTCPHQHIWHEALLQCTPDDITPVG